MAGLRRSSWNAKVGLCLVGPKTIIPNGEITVKTLLTNTWSHLLMEELKLKVPADRQIYICNSGFRKSDQDGEGGKGWSAELDDKISDFIGKYQINKKVFRIHVWCQKRNDRVLRRRRRSVTPHPHGRGQGQDGGDDGRPRYRPQQAVVIPRRRERAPTPHPSGAIKKTTENPAARGPRRQGRPSSASPAGRRGPTTYRTKGVQTFEEEEEVASTSSGFNGRRPPKSQRNGGPPPPKRLKIQRHQQVQQVDLELEPEVGVGVSTVPGPHVFLKQRVPAPREEVEEEVRIDNVKREVPLVEVLEIEDDDEGFASQRERTDEEDDEEVDEDGGEENQLLEEEDDGGVEERDEFGRMSDEEIGGNEEEDEMDDNGGGDQDDEELRQLGIRYEDIKGMAGRRFAGFSNPFMLRIRDEMRKLMRNNEWMDVFQRSPLSFYLIQQVFKE